MCLHDFTGVCWHNVLFLAGCFGDKIAFTGHVDVTNLIDTTFQDVMRSFVMVMFPKFYQKL